MYIPTWIIIVVVIFVYIYYKQSKKKAEFSPFHIQILPNWYELLKDHKLVDENSWKELQGKIYSDKKVGYDVLRYGISFTVLRADENSDLIYNNNRQSFHSEVDFREKIEDIKIPNKDIHIPYTPELWVKWGIEGYEMGITTPESFSKVIMVGDDNDLIKLTTIPYSLFQMHKYRFGVMKPEQIEEQLKKKGLSKDETNEKFKTDILFHVSDELNHKYFKIYYEYI